MLPVVPKYLGLLRSQYWRRDRLEDLARRRLQKIIAASLTIPFYKKSFGGAHPGDNLRDFPTLKRQDIPLLNQSTREVHRGQTEFFSDNSSGSTGMPVEFLFDPGHQSGRYAARIRYLRANGWNPAHRNVWIVAQTSDDDASIDSRLQRSIIRLRSRFLPVFAPFEHQVDLLMEACPEFLYTMPSNLDGLLRVFEKRQTRLAGLKRVFTGAEVLEDSMRTRVTKVLGVPISDNYGSTEGFISWQCPKETYHVNAEHMMVEIVDEQGQPAAPGQMGKVLITTLENRLMPLIRYEIGDYAIASNHVCGCGRSLPVIGKVIGRGINLFRLPGNQLVSPWPLVGPLKGRPQFRQFQIVQETVDRYLVRFVADQEPGGDTREEVRSEFSAILGHEISLAFERIASIPRTAGGKFMTALSMCAIEAGAAKE
ncbi:MAG: AMP-binding protein [Candidatus Binatus sp.]